LYYAILFLSLGALFIPSLYTRAGILFVMGRLVYLSEKHIGLTVPASPGTIFWFSIFFSYVVGGLGCILLLNEQNALGTHYLSQTLFYLGIGIFAYIISIETCSVLIKNRSILSLNLSNLNFNNKNITIFCTIFTIPVLLVGKLGALNLVYYNIVIGALQSFQFLPMILLAVYLTYKNKNIIICTLLFISTFSIPIAGIINDGYGRNQLLIAVASLIVVLLSLHNLLKLKLTLKHKIAFVILAFAMLVYFGVMTQYRDSINHRAISGHERSDIFNESLKNSYNSNIFSNSCGPIVRRALEHESLELIYLVDKKIVPYFGWSTEDFRQILVSWIPRVFYPAKGVGYGRDIMVYYGFTVYNNLPVTILADAFRRSGVTGVFVIFYLIGLIATTIAIKLQKLHTTMGVILTFYFALLHLNIYTADAVTIARMYIYRLPSSAIIIFVLLNMTKILQKPIYTK
jgi:hypothetical protein